MKFNSPVFATASGSLAGITYAHNQHGHYVRAKTRPVNPQTRRQSQNRAAFASLAVTWSQSLSENQRASWKLWSANTPQKKEDGISFNIGGQRAFIRFNSVRLQIGESRIDAAPTIFNNGNPVTSIELRDPVTPNVFGIDPFGVTMLTRIRFAGSTSTTGDLVLYFGAPVNPSRTFPKGPYQLALFKSVTSGLSSRNLSFPLTQFMNDNVILTAGQVRPMKFRVVYDDGRLSDAYSLLAPVVAGALFKK